jgi:hypothetical protein
VVFAIFAGANVLHLISRRGNYGLRIPESLCVSYSMGVGFISLEMLILHLLKMPLNVPIIAAPWLMVLVFNVLLILVKRPVPSTQVPVFLSWEKRSGSLRLLLFSGISLEVFLAFFRACIKPIESYDAVAIYAIKSKIFFLAGSIPQDFFARLAGRFPHPDYPLNIPLFESFVYLSMGTLNDQLVKIIFPLYFVSVLVMMYFAVRRFASVNYALIFTFLLASIPQFNAYATNAYLDLPLAAYCFISAVFLFDWLKDARKIQSLVISGINAGLAGWTKNEGLMYCAVFIATILAHMLLEPKKELLKYMKGLSINIFIIFLLLSPWLFIRYVFRLINTDIGAITMNPVHIFKQLHKVWPILYEFQKQVLGPKKWNIIWVAVIAAFVLRFRKVFRGELRPVSIMLVFIICGYVYFYLIAPIDINFFLSKTWSRFLVQFLPIAVYWLALILKEDIEI